MRTRYGRKVVVPIMYMIDSEVDTNPCLCQIRHFMLVIEDAMKNNMSMTEKIPLFIDLYDALLASISAVKKVERFKQVIIKKSKEFMDACDDLELHRKIQLVLTRF
jgi:hypothetical protein